MSLRREVYRELIQAPDREIPQKLLADCRCVAVFPRVIKGAIDIGARFGRAAADEAAGERRGMAGHASRGVAGRLSPGRGGRKIAARNALRSPMEART